MYRPEGWEEIKKSILEEPNGMDKWCCSSCADKVVELTADAMLEGLKGNEYIKMTGGRTFKLDFPQGCKGGYLVFIPEEG